MGGQPRYSEGLAAIVTYAWKSDGLKVVVIAADVDIAGVAELLATLSASVGASADSS